MPLVPSPSKDIGGRRAVVSADQPEAVSDPLHSGRLRPVVAADTGQCNTSGRNAASGIPDRLCRRLHLASLHESGQVATQPRQAPPRSCLRRQHGLLRGCCPPRRDRHDQATRGPVPRLQVSILLSRVGCLWVAHRPRSASESTVGLVKSPGQTRRSDAGAAARVDFMIALLEKTMASWVERYERWSYGSNGRFMGTNRRFCSMADLLIPRRLATQHRNTILASLNAFAISTAVKSSARSGCLTVL